MSLFGGIYRSFTTASAAPKIRKSESDFRSRFRLARMYVRSRTWVHRKPAAFVDVKSYVLFLGHARSGGTLAGALLDAHPNAIIADEVDIFPYLYAGFQREQLFHILLERSQRHARRGHIKAGREGKKYSYLVPGAWQGAYDQLLVIGNRKAGISTQRLGSDSQAVHKLMELLGTIDLKMVVSIRNPYDTITTMSIRSGRELESGIRQYFANCAAIGRLQGEFPPEKMLVIRHEDLLDTPVGCLQFLCAYLQIPAPLGYISACYSILNPTPAQSRHKVDWSLENIQSVKSQMQQYSFLEGYSYES